jgi:hypothetical protein
MMMVEPTQMGTHPMRGQTIHAVEGGEPPVSERPSQATPAEPGQRVEESPKASPQEQLKLSPEAEAVVAELKARDREVKAHEQAHMAAGAGLTGGASYSFQTGPDGQRYAVGGEVQISTGAVAGDPEATIEKAEQVRKAALAPANPSAQDLSVAAAATQTITTAQAELTAQLSGGDAGKGDDSGKQAAAEPDKSPSATTDRPATEEPAQRSSREEEALQRYRSVAATQPGLQQEAAVRLFV